MHEPTKLELISQSTSQGGRGQRKWTVWHVNLKCPTCQRKFTRLKNTYSSKKFVCIGNGKLTLNAQKPTK